MSAPSTYAHFKFRQIGRCPSPPTWGCYELATSSRSASPSGSDRSSCSSDCESDDDGSVSDVEEHLSSQVQVSSSDPPPPEDKMDLEDQDEDQAKARRKPLPESDNESCSRVVTPQPQEDEDLENQRLKKSQDKGKGKEIVPTVPSPSPSMDNPTSPTKKHTKRKKERAVLAYRPILTIRQSHGWVWNQDLFVPPYIKDRCKFHFPYRVSISPTNSSTNFNGMDYEVECVEIRVEGGIEGALNDILFS